MAKPIPIMLTSAPDARLLILVIPKMPHCDTLKYGKLSIRLDLTNLKSFNAGFVFSNPRAERQNFDTFCTLSLIRAFEQQVRRNMGYILLVEDEALLAFMLMADLKAATNIPVEAYNSKDKAFERLAKGVPALAFLDINLGNETSFAIAEWLIDRHAPTYFVTSYSLASLEKMKIPASLSCVEVIPKVEFRNKISDLLV